MTEMGLSRSDTSAAPKKFTQMMEFFEDRFG